MADTGNKPYYENQWKYRRAQQEVLGEVSPSERAGLDKEKYLAQNGTAVKEAYLRMGGRIVLGKGFAPVVETPKKSAKKKKKK